MREKYDSPNEYFRVCVCGLSLAGVGGSAVVLAVVVERHTAESTEEVWLLWRQLDAVVAAEAWCAGHACARDAADLGGARDVRLLPLEVERVGLANLAEIDGVDSVGRGRHDLSRFGGQ